MEAVTATITGHGAQSSHPRLIRNCGVPLDTVESAVLSRRIGSAAAARLLPSNTQNSLATGKTASPATRYAASADVVRRREQMKALSEPAVTVVKSIFTSSTPLTHLGIELESARPQTASTHTKPGPTLSRPASSSYDLVRKTAAAQQALHAVDSVLPHVVDNTPYLQHLRERAHKHVVEQAEAAGIKPEGEPASFAELMDMLVETNQQQLFAEWNGFLGKCDKAWFDSLPESDRQDLFTKFIRCRGRILPHNPPAAAEATAQQMLADGEALDDLAPPSGAPPAILPPIKLMMHAPSKRAYLEHLVQQQQMSPSPAPCSSNGTSRTPARLTSARQERFEEKKLLIQQNAQHVFTSSVEAQRRHQRDFALRTAISHAAHNLRLHQRGNVSSGHNAMVLAKSSPGDQRLRTPSPVFLDIAPFKRASPV